MRLSIVAVLLLWGILLLALSSYGADYQIGEGDLLDVAVWGVKELNVQVKVRPDGKITVPGLGEVVASGVSPSQLQTHLAERLKELVKNPIVTVTVKEITNSKVYIFGSGVKASVYDLSRRTTTSFWSANLVKPPDSRIASITFIPSRYSMALGAFTAPST